MIVVDTNVIAFLMLPGEHTDAARAALVRDPAWAAPLLWRSELRNVLAVQVKAGHLKSAQAIEIQEIAEALMSGREFAVNSARVIELAATSGRSAYDCEFVALAESLHVPLVTSDRRLRASFPATATALEAFDGSV